jgi:hypothetical protein
MLKMAVKMTSCGKKEKKTIVKKMVVMMMKKSKVQMRTLNNNLFSENVNM